MALFEVRNINVVPYIIDSDDEEPESTHKRDAASPPAEHEPPRKRRRVTADVDLKSRVEVPQQESNGPEILLVNVAVHGVSLLPVMCILYHIDLIFLSVWTLLQR